MANSKGKKRLIRLSEMADNLGMSMMYKRYYFEMSQYIHSAPASTSEVADPEHFVIDTEVDDRFLYLALSIGNVFTMCMFARADAKFHLGIEALVKEAQILMHPTADSQIGI